jgi:ribose transport system substrate-binding protein
VACKRAAAGAWRAAARERGARPAGKPLRIAGRQGSTNPIFISARTGAGPPPRTCPRVGALIEVLWMTPPRRTVPCKPSASRRRSGGRGRHPVACSDADRLTPAIDEAVEHGVEVMTFDSDAPKSKRFAYYGVDDHRLGQDIMVQLSKLLGGKGKVAILAGNQNAPNLQSRVDGVRDEAAHHPGIQIVGTFFHVERPEDAAAEVMRVGNLHRDLRGWAMVGGWALFTKTLLTELIPRRSSCRRRRLPPELRYVESGLAPAPGATAVPLGQCRRNENCRQSYPQARRSGHRSDDPSGHAETSAVGR